ncbi:MAG: DUF72 domain-containing protein [Verrucomicrobiota bacterium]
MRARIAALAADQVFIGTSSWKYTGWMGQIYTHDRYVYRGRFSQKRFEEHCLAEYAEVFKTVSVDAAYYKFPDRQFLGKLVADVPPDFQFSLKVTDDITLKRFPNLPRFGRRAGQENLHFLNADLFLSAFLSACEPFKNNLGAIMFEFTRFHRDDFATGRDFVAALDSFLEKLPRGWRYGVEIRNRTFLHPEYFAMLARHNVSHVFNSWEDMPPVDEQIAMPGSFTSPDFFVARFLLKPGRKYEDAVKTFSPYDRVKDIYPAGRAAATDLVRQAKKKERRPRGYIHVNNRFEGNALESIAAIIEEV